MYNQGKIIDDVQFCHDIVRECFSLRRYVNMIQYYPIINNCSVRTELFNIEALARIMHNVFREIGLPIEVNIKNPVLECYISTPPKQLRAQYHPAFCTMMHKSANTEVHCDYSDICMKNSCNEKRYRVIGECWAGLIEVIVPIMYDDEVIGLYQFGQFLHEPPTEEKFNILYGMIKDDFIDFNSLHDAYFSLKVISYDEVERIISKSIPIFEEIHRSIESILKKDDLFINVVKGNDVVQKFIGNTPGIMHLKHQLKLLCASEAPVLIRGESGTGKEHVAQIIHSFSKRRSGSFITKNSASIPDNLIESELFGHKRGAFTDARSDYIGLFEKAHKGTLFLDEIGNISPSMQLKILRVLEDGLIQPIGDTQAKRADFRLITATNTNLEETICKGDFRSDLYYRISTIEIYIPPLREREGRYQSAQLLLY